MHFPRNFFGSCGDFCIFGEKNKNHIIMETQLVRLDAPYNLICNKEAKFGLHIATLIVINPFYNKEYGMSNISCYPVVAQNNELEGELWNEHELETCKVICRHQGVISLHIIKDIMDYYFGWSNLPTYEYIWDLKKALISYESKIVLPKIDLVKISNEVENIISEYNVELKFDNDTESEVCTIYSSDDSCFFFLECIDNNPESRAHPGNDEDTTIYRMALLRDAYLMAFDMEGVKKITFFTKARDYQEYVDKLNCTHKVLEVSFINNYLNEKHGSHFGIEAIEQIDSSNEGCSEECKKIREQLSAYFSNSAEHIHYIRKEDKNKDPKIFHDNLNVDKIKSALAKFDRKGLGPKQFCKLAKAFFVGIGWLPVQVDTYFVSWMKYNNIVDMKDNGLTHVKIDDEKAQVIKKQLKNTFQFKNDKDIWEDRDDFYILGRWKVNKGD